MERLERLTYKCITTVLLIAMLLVLCGSAFDGFSFVSEAKDTLPAYSGSASVQLNGNIPEFSSSEITTVSYEKYGKLDSLGRCSTAMACIGVDLMPTEERGSIGMVKPTGWNQNKYL